MTTPISFRGHEWRPRLSLPIPVTQIMRELVKWPTYTLDDRPTMIFDTPSSVRSDPFGAERLVWRDVPLGNLLMG